VKRRKSRRRWPRRWKHYRQRAYAHNDELHEYEDAIVLALLMERGSGSAREWSSREPGRWREKPLAMSLKRVRLAHPSITHERQRSAFTLSYNQTYYYWTDPQSKEDAA
jgi:hypothetical protein